MYRVCCSHVTLHMIHDMQLCTVTAFCSCCCCCWWWRCFLKRKHDVGEAAFTSVCKCAHFCICVCMCAYVCVHMCLLHLLPLGNLSNVQLTSVCHHFSSSQAPGTPFILSLSTKAIRKEEGRKSTAVRSLSHNHVLTNPPGWSCRTS